MYRALFWIAVVAVLMPHEPDLGLGRPSAFAAPGMPTGIAQLIGNSVGTSQTACSDHAQGCAAVLGFVDTFQNMAVRSLAQVKAEIEESQRERTLHLAMN